VVYQTHGNGRKERNGNGKMGVGKSFCNTRTVHMLSNRCHVHSIGNGYIQLLADSSCVKGHEMAAVVERYAWVVCPRWVGTWD